MERQRMDIGNTAIWGTIIGVVILIGVILGFSKETIDRNLDRQAKIQKLQVELLKDTWIRDYYDEVWQIDKFKAMEMIDNASRLIEYYDSQELGKLSKEGGR